MLSHLVWDLVCHPSLTWFENGLTRQKPGLTHVLHMFFVRIFKSSSCKLCDDDDDEVWRSNKITDWGNIEISKSWVLSHSCILFTAQCNTFSLHWISMLHCCMSQHWRSSWNDDDTAFSIQIAQKDSTSFISETLFCFVLRENQINSMMNLTHFFPVYCADSCPNFKMWRMFSSPHYWHC